MPKSIEVDEATLTDSYGKFEIQPLERGFGITLGNALRRVLLSSIQGAAIDSIRLENVHHEFSTIKGIVEDVPEIILNLKEIDIKLHSDDPVRFTVEIKGPHKLIADDINTCRMIILMLQRLHYAVFRHLCIHQPDLLLHGRACHKLSMILVRLLRY